MKTVEVLTLVNELKNKHAELRYWTVDFNNRKRAFGLCNYTKRTIELSRVLIPFMSDEAIKDTIIHEIAHALTHGDGHGYRWQRKCIELGGDGQRVHGAEKYKDGEKGVIEFKKATAKYTLTCPVCQRESFYNRKPKHSISCGNHGLGRYDERYKLVISQNY